MDKENKVKKEKKEKIEDPNKIKFSEKLALKFKRKLLLSTTKTFLIIAILVMAFVCINLWARTANLPQLDVTENQLYTLSDSSKNAVSKIENEIKMYVFGVDETDILFDLLKQYNKANEKITYEVLSKETNLEMVNQYGLQDGYGIIIMKSGNSEKIIDVNADFITYDYTTYQTVDITEQTLTNSMLGLIVENKPKVYLVQGHGEYAQNAMTLFVASLDNEAFQFEFIDLAAQEKVPDDCDVLAFISPSKDLYDVEVPFVTDYINKGGNIYFAMDVISKKIEMPNFQKVLDLYGVSVQNGYILEYKANKSVQAAPYIFLPEINETHEITKDIFTDSNRIWLTYAAKLNFKSNEELTALNVVKETLLKSSDESLFIADVDKSLEVAAESAEIGSAEIAAAVTKIVIPPEGAVNSDTESKLVITSSASFLSDTVIPLLSESIPLSYQGSNIDFALNSMAYLGDKENLLTIRKDFNSATYTPTFKEDIIVVAIIVGVPVLIVIVGFIVYGRRKRRK